MFLFKQMNKGETFVLLWRKLKHCDKSLVRHIVQLYWLPAETRLAILLRIAARREFFQWEMTCDAGSKHWWGVLREIKRRKGILIPIYFTISDWRTQNSAAVERNLVKYHERRMNL